LYVFLIYPDEIKRAPSDPEIGPRMYRRAHNKIVQIYPDSVQK
jgi:hypothetical protein